MPTSFAWVWERRLRRTGAIAPKKGSLQIAPREGANAPDDDLIAFEPKSGKHAIAEVVFAINYEGIIKPEAIAAVKARRDSYKDFLPKEQAVAGFQFSMGAGGPGPNVSKMQDGGFTWQQFKPDGDLAWQLTVQQDFLSANCLNYTSWAEVWKQVEAWLLDLHPILVKAGHRAKAITLQYIDQFNRKQPVTSHILSELFSKESAYLPARFFTNGELWHVHQGWIDQIAEPLKGQKLSVLNIGATRSGGVNTVSIDHLIRVDLAPESAPMFTAELDGSSLDKLMNCLHDENKTILANLLAPDVCAYIGLNK